MSYAWFVSPGTDSVRAHIIFDMPPDFQAPLMRVLYRNLDASLPIAYQIDYNVIDVRSICMCLPD